jgi:hypothetical protein
MVTWTPAPCGVALSKELDEVYGAERPNDGTIGDLAHSARASDHNPKRPRPPGWVDARDIYDWRALDADRLMHALAAGRDRRILYVISHARMCSSYPTSRYPAWTWRPYSGVNGHFTHGHISFRPEYRNDRSTWLTPAVRAALGLARPAPAPVPPAPVPTPTEDPDMFTLIRRPDGLQALISPALCILSPSDPLIADYRFSGMVRNDKPVEHGAENFRRLVESLGVQVTS